MFSNFFELLKDGSDRDGDTASMAEMDVWRWPVTDPDDKPKASSRATLEILGVPGEEVSIFPETRLDAPPAAIFIGQVPPDGCLRLRVPRFELVIVAAGFGRATVRFDADETLRQVDVRHTRQMP